MDEQHIDGNGIAGLPGEIAGAEITRCPIQHELRGATGNRRVLTLTRFETDNGPTCVSTSRTQTTARPARLPHERRQRPDLRVYLTNADASQGSAGEDPVDLGALTANVGDRSTRSRGASISIA